MDGNDELGNSNLKLVHVGGYYYVEENLGSDKYAYFKANVTIKTGGAQNIVTVDSSRTNKISTSDQPYVNGTGWVVVCLPVGYCCYIWKTPTK